MRGSLSKSFTRLVALRKRRSPDDLLRFLTDRPTLLSSPGCYGSYSGDWVFSTDALWFRTDSGAYELTEYAHVLRYWVTKHELEVHTASTAFIMAGDPAAPWLVAHMLCYLDAALLWHWQSADAEQNPLLRRLRAEGPAGGVEAAERGVLLADPRVAERAPHVISSHARVVDGPRFVSQWVLRTHAVAISSPTVPALLVLNPLGLVVMLPLQRTFNVLLWCDVPSWGTNKDCFSIMHTQPAYVDVALGGTKTYVFRTAHARELESGVRPALESGRGGAAPLPRLYPGGDMAVLGSPSTRLLERFSSAEAAAVDARADALLRNTRALSAAAGADAAARVARLSMSEADDLAYQLSRSDAELLVGGIGDGTDKTDAAATAAADDDDDVLFIRGDEADALGSYEM